MAPLDADDVWHREKIERQMMIARRNSTRASSILWSRLIDADDHVIRNAPRAEHEGEVLTEHLQMNFIGNGSTPISMRALGNLRYNQNFDACADYLLQGNLRCGPASASCRLISRATESLRTASRRTLCG